MKLSRMVNETFECVKINGILRNLTNDEMRIYKKVKNEGKVYKSDLSEFDANVATSMVTKGLLRRIKSKTDDGKHGRLYFITRGRKGNLVTKQLDEVAPPDKKIEKWIKKNKKRFKDKYGKDYGKYLYGKAWNTYNGKLNESVNDVYSIDIELDDDKSDVDDAIKELGNVYTEMSNIIDSSDYGKYFTSAEGEAESWRLPWSKKNELARVVSDLVHVLDKNDWFDGGSSTPFYWLADKIYYNEDDSGDDFDDYMEKLRDDIRQAAYDSGDYNEFYDPELDSDATWENITDLDANEIIDNYCSSSLIHNEVNEMISELRDGINAINEYANNIVSDGLYWDGSYEDDGTEDHIQTNQNQINTLEAIKKTYSEIISELEGYVEKLENYDDSVNVILDVCNEVSYLNYPDDLVRNCNPVKVLKRFEDSHITEGLLQSARDSAYDSGDYNSYYDSELDDDATWENVNNTSYRSLARTPSRDVLHDVRVIYDIVGKLFELVKNKENFNMELTGSEFDESFNPLI